MNNNQKVQKEYPDFVKEVEKLDAASLKQRIVGLQEGQQASDAHKEENDVLKAARAVVKDLNGPYNDVKKAVKLKTRYLIDLLKERN